MLNVTRQLIGVIMVGVFLFQAISTTVVLSNYHLNKEYITKMFCINKAEVKMKCNGKCHLKKQLKKAEEKEKSPFNSVNEKHNFNLFSSQIIEAPLSIAALQLKSFIDRYFNASSDTYLDAIFHPPQA